MAPPQPFVVITRVPIPASLPPATVIAALQTCLALITPNPYLERYERRQVEHEEVVNDSFFRHDGRNPEGFVVYDRVPVIPGVGAWATKIVVILCIFQSFEHGVRCRGHADGGVTVRSSYEVRRRGEVTDGPALVAGPEDGDYELLDIASIECGALVKPFVKMRFASSHQSILRQVVVNLMQSAEPQPSNPQAGYTAQ
ncbi:hypothetical protein BT67DRAFT_436855 [Trichocladium antarcticum]|uniref:DUF7053 domain-containing protein n=1 Tax=Trichocladium antarcticum TaxID=1450529 RepID=A0AAN6ZA24_9PEZI|nr:hypothetical protein BT67DRAFT_436855 [Trichocladium antarcticum]